jgi:hypothetical protein
MKWTLAHYVLPRKLGHLKSFGRLSMDQEHHRPPFMINQRRCHHRVLGVRHHAFDEAVHGFMHSWATNAHIQRPTLACRIRDCPRPEGDGVLTAHRRGPRQTRSRVISRIRLSKDSYRPDNVSAHH